MNTKLAAALSGAALVLALAGCGDDRNEKLGAWAKTYCDTRKRQIEAEKVALDDIGEVRQDEKPADLKRRLSKDIDVLAETRATLAEDIGGGAAPPVEDGGKRQKEVTRALNDNAKAYEILKKRVDDLGVKDRSKFARGLEDIGDEVEILIKRDNRALEKFQRGEVGAAMAGQARCRPDSPDSSPDSSPAA